MKNRLVLFLWVFSLSFIMADPLHAQKENAARKLMDKATIAFETQN